MLKYKLKKIKSIYKRIIYLNKLENWSNKLWDTQR
jgi:hypothetical protein